jgi:hypothetical protein
MQDILPGTRVLVLVDLAIAITLVELAVLCLLHWRTGRGVAPRDLLPNLVAGLCLMAAVRAGITGAGWGWVAAGLMASGLAHAADLRARWRSRV